MVVRWLLSKGGLLLAVMLFLFAHSAGRMESVMSSDDECGTGRYHFDFDDVGKGPYLNLRSALLVNYDNGDVVYAKNADKVRPVASISKLVTAMVILDSGMDLDSTATITRDDARRSSKSRLRTGSKLTLRDLMHAMLIGSDNRAARALARTVSGSIEAFAAEMNAFVKQKGLVHTSFVEPTGLSAKNVSTAHEVAKIVHYAFDYDMIRDITERKKYRARLLNQKNGYRDFINTNRLIWSSYDVLAGKTGYIRAADYCLATLVQNSEGEKLTLVVLGVPGDRLRFKEANRLLRWGFKRVA